MDHIGIGVHKRESQIYIPAESREVIDPEPNAAGWTAGVKLASPACRRLACYASCELC